jgi:hypothetical protein
MPKQFLVPLENGAYVFSAFFRLWTSIQRSGMNYFGFRYKTGSRCINIVVIPTGIPAGIIHELYARSLSGAVRCERDAIAGLRRKPSIITAVKNGSCSNIFLLNPVVGKWLDLARNVGVGGCWEC